LYWTNIPGIEQPDDLGIVLRDVLEYEPEEFAVKNTERNLRHTKFPDEKSLTCTATMHKGAGNNGMTLVPLETYNTPKQVGTATDIKGYDIIKRVYSEDGKSPTLTTMGGGHREPKVAVKSMTEVRTPEANKIRREHKKKTGKDWSPRHMRHLVERKDDKSNTITANTSKQHTIQISKIRDKSKTVRSGGRLSYDRHEWDSVDELHWRKLTPLECERLQTVPDNYTEGVSNTQRYKMLGNGFTVRVIEHILKNMEV